MGCPFKNCEVLKLDESRYEDEVSQWILDRIEQKLNETGRCVVGLSGGSTPFPIYRKLGDIFNPEWTNVSFFLVDERFINATEESSNQKQIYCNLCKSGNIHPSNILAPNVALDLESCVRGYNSKVEQLLSEFGGRASLLVLGMGEDGHIASIFPNLPQRIFDDLDDPSKYAIQTDTDQFDVRERITVTYRVLRGAENAVFLLKGQKKAAVWEDMLNSSQNLPRWPAKAVLEMVPSKVFLC